MNSRFHSNSSNSSGNSRGAFPVCVKHAESSMKIKSQAKSDVLETARHKTQLNRARTSALRADQLRPGKLACQLIPIQYWEHTNFRPRINQLSNNHTQRHLI